VPFSWEGRYGSCSAGTEEIWAIFLGNKGDMDPVLGVQGRYSRFLFMANRGGVGPGQGSETGKKGSCLGGVKLERRESCSGGKQVTVRYFHKGELSCKDMVINHEVKIRNWFCMVLSSRLVPKIF
jgi:hypothetical protein